MAKAGDMIITVTLDEESKELLALLRDAIKSLAPNPGAPEERQAGVRRLIEQQVAEEFHTGPIMVQRSSSQAGLSSIR